MFLNVSKYLYLLFLYYLDYWSSAAGLKDVWKVKGIVDEMDTFENSCVELSDDEQNPTQTAHSDTSEIEEDSSDEDESCDSNNSEVCGTIASNKFAALGVFGFFKKYIRKQY